MTQEGSTELVPVPGSNRSARAVVGGAVAVSARTAMVATGRATATVRLVLWPAGVVVRTGWRSRLAGPVRLRAEHLIGALEDAGRREERRIVGALDRGTGAALDRVLESGRIERIVDRVIASPRTEATVQRVLEGPFPDRVAAILIESEVIERVTAEVIVSEIPARVVQQLTDAQVGQAVLEQVLEGDALDRLLQTALERPELAELITEALDSQATERLVQAVLESPGLDRLVARVLDSDFYETLIDQILQSEELWRLVEQIAHSPEVMEAISAGSASLAGEVADQVRRRTIVADDLAERIARGVLRRPRRPPAAPAGDEKP
jgi:DNA-binding TFAR19-related protein (PDSD5 family)